MLHRTLLMMCVALLTVVTSVQAKLPKGIEKVTSVEGITEYQMDNGLQILLFPDPTQETITVNITYHVGSKHENYGETGMAHLLEHLVFKGTPNHPNIPKELTDRGAEPNGTTWTDRTNYFETFNATEDNLKWALDLEADRMVNSFIAKEDLDSEMTVVRNELENGENSPIRVLIERLLSVSYDWHNYGKSTIGARSDLENVDISNLQAFYKKYYQPDNATLIVAGKIDEEKTLELIKKYFGKLKKPKRELTPLYTEENIQDGERVVSVRRPGDVQVVATAYKVPAGSDPMFPAVEVLTYIMADSSSGRLHENLVKKELAASTFGFAFQWAEPGVVNFMAQVAKDKDLSAAEEAMIATIEGVADSPITEEEVNQAKAALIKQFELSFNSSERIALNLSEWVGMGDWRLMFLNRDRLEAVDQAQVQKAAESYLIQSNRSLGRFIPTQDPVRADSIKRYSQEEISAMVRDYEGREAVAMGEDFDPSFDNIDARTEKRQLEQGTPVVLLPKKTRGESVVLRVRLDIGNLEDLRNQGVVGGLTADMLDRGTENYSRQELQTAFDELKASVSVYGGATGATARVTTTKENLPKVIELLKEVFHKPTFADDELQVLKRERIVGLEQQKQQPQTQVFRTLSRHVFPYEPSNPNYQMPIDDEIAAIEAVTVDDLKQFHADNYGAQAGEIVVVGDFDEAPVMAALNDVFGNWQSQNPYDRIENEYVEVEAINQFINTPDKAGAAFGAMMAIPMSDEHPDYPAMLMANQMLGGGFISSRLANRLRQQDGLSYGAGSNFRAGSFDPVGTFVAYAICAPENLPKVEQGFKEELQKAINEGFTAEELADAKKAVLENNVLDRAKDARLAGTLQSNIDLERTMQWQKNLEQKIRDLTVEEVNAAFKKHIVPEKISIVKAGDESKIK